MKIFRVSADFRFFPDPIIFSAFFYIYIFFIFFLIIIIIFYFFLISTIDITGMLNTEQYMLTS